MSSNEKDERHKTPQPHLQAPTESGIWSRDKKRVYVHPALIIVSAIAIIVALIIVVLSFNRRWDAAEQMGATITKCRTDLEVCRTQSATLEIERENNKRLQTQLAAQEAEAEILAKIARETSPAHRGIVDTIRAKTRRYLFTVDSPKDKTKVVHELCGEYAKNDKGLTCY